MEAATTTMEVVVHKANLPLVKNESLGSFTRKLRDDGRAFLMRKFNLVPEKADVFMLEVFVDKVVFDIFEFKATDPRKRQRFVGLGFTRKNDGGFEFNNSIELERVTMFRPKETLVTKRNASSKQTVTKSNASPTDTAFVSVEKGIHDKPKPKKIDTGEKNAKKPVKKQLAWADGWQETEKSFWNSVV